MSRPLRVLHCLWNGGVGGAERAVWLLVREQLQDPDLAPSVCFADDSGPYADLARGMGCPVVGLGLGSGRDLTRLPAAAAQMRGFDIHHFHTPDPLLMLTSILCPETRRVYTQRAGTRRYSGIKRLKHKAVGLLLRSSFHGFSGNTKHGADYGSARYRILRQRFSVTYNGINGDDLVPLRDGAGVRAELGLTPDEFVIGTAANLKPWKRIDRLIRAIAELDDPAVRLVIVGDGVHRPSLERTVQELGLATRVIFTGLTLHVPDYLQVMDAFCLPSNEAESFGNASVEAMFLGVPTVVFSDGGGMVEHIENRSTGFIVASQRELEDTLRLLKTNVELRCAVGVHGQASVRSHYTPARCAASYRALYASALGANNGLVNGATAAEDSIG